MPLKPHPNDPDKMVYVSRQYDIPQPQGIPQLQGVTTAQPAQEPVCPECKVGVLYECVACSSSNYPPKPAQEPWPEEPFGHMAGGVQPPQAEVLVQAVPDETLTIVYQSGYYDGKKAALAGREWNFCERCGKRTADLTVIHTCTPPQEKNG